MKKKFNAMALIVAFLASYGAAFIGSLFTAPAVKSDWYATIKPSITPPDFVFPIVWNILFFLIALSLFISWTHASKKARKAIAWAFAANLVLNVLWSAVFFWLRNPLLALIEIFFLLASIMIMMYIVYKINALSAYLLLPYLLWVCFAIVLNVIAVGNLM